MSKVKICNNCNGHGCVLCDYKGWKNQLKGDTPDLRAWNLPIAIDGIEIQHSNDTDSAPLEVYVWFNGHKAKIFSERILPGIITDHHITAGGIRAALVGDDTSVKVED